MAAPGERKWLIAISVMLGTILEVLDTSIVNVALPHMQGAFSASVDEITWVLTSYLVANGIVIPMTGWLSGRFGRKRYFITSIVVFTVASMFCGAAPDLRTIVLFRIVQGLGGAAMLPSSQAILMETFPPDEQAIAMATWGVGLMVAPVVGPTLGGWITDTYSWRWCFYINLPFGLIATLMASRFLEEPPHAQARRTAPDWLGIALLVVGLGAIQIVLDRGERADWFAAAWVRALTATAVVALGTFVWWELGRAREPVVRLRLLRERGFAIGSTLIALLAFVLFGTLTLWPLFLQNLMGYTASQAGWAMAPRGIATGLSMFVVGRLSRRFDPRLLISIGVVILVVAQVEMSHFYLQLGWWQLVWPSIIQGIGMGFIFTLLSTTSLARLPREVMGSAASIYNLMRNLGASFGIAILGTLLLRRGQLHQAVLATHTTPFHAPFRQALEAIPGAMAARGFVVDGTQAAALLYGQLRAQATMLAFEDCFLVAGIVALGIVLGMAAMPSARPTPGAPSGAH
ncbi:MAG TPA: DHA2 family efflux MFS transporter permease subunit [Candidatus Binatia bacterium]|nr:DHA2 family efflux MFS transporter permease subunit [Candidatus Binatia bacterium]